MEQVIKHQKDKNVSIESPLNSQDWLEILSNFSFKQKINITWLNSKWLLLRKYYLKSDDSISDTPLNVPERIEISRKERDNFILVRNSFFKENGLEFKHKSRMHIWHSVKKILEQLSVIWGLFSTKQLSNYSISIRLGSCKNTLTTFAPISLSEQKLSLLSMIKTPIIFNFQKEAVFLDHTFTLETVQFELNTSFLENIITEKRRKKESLTQTAQKSSEAKKQHLLQSMDQSENVSNIKFYEVDIGSDLPCLFMPFNLFEQMKSQSHSSLYSLNRTSNSINLQSEVEPSLPNALRNFCNPPIMQKRKRKYSTISSVQQHVTNKKFPKQTKKTDDLISEQKTKKARFHPSKTN